MPPDKERGRPCPGSGPSDTVMPDITIPAAADIASLLELSDERDQWWRRVQVAYRDGYRDGELAHQEDYGRGYADGVMARKHAEHQAVNALELYIRRWGPRGREHFGDAREGDFPGRGGAAA